MKPFQITSQDLNTILYSGHFDSFKSCLEQAVNDNINLSHADLSYKNLMGAMLDGATLQNCNFTGSNLSMANLSEANLKNTTFAGADLYNACLAYSDISDANFENTSFGATDIAQANVQNSTFSSPTCFTLDFVWALDMSGCSYKMDSGDTYAMTKPPVVIKGVSEHPLIFLDQCVLSGQKIWAHDRWIGILKNKNHQQ